MIKTVKSYELLFWLWTTIHNNFAGSFRYQCHPQTDESRSDKVT